MPPGLHRATLLMGHQLMFLEAVVPPEDSRKWHPDPSVNFTEVSPKCLIKRKPPCLLKKEEKLDTRQKYTRIVPCDLVLVSFFMSSRHHGRAPPRCFRIIGGMLNSSVDDKQPHSKSAILKKILKQFSFAALKENLA